VELPSRVGFWLLLGLVIIYGPSLASTKRVPSPWWDCGDKRDRRGVAVCRCPRVGDLANFLRTCQSFAIPTNHRFFRQPQAIILPKRWRSRCWAAASRFSQPCGWIGLVDEDSDYKTKARGSGIANIVASLFGGIGQVRNDWPEL